jgi:hypothetical protein
MFVAPRWQMPGGFALDGLGAPSYANQRRRCCRAAQILRTEAIMSLSGVPSGHQGFQKPGRPRRALLKHIMALCIIIIEFEIGSY